MEIFTKRLKRREKYTAADFLSEIKVADFFSAGEMPMAQVVAYYFPDGRKLNRQTLILVKNADGYRNYKQKIASFFSLVGNGLDTISLNA